MKLYLEMKKKAKLSYNYLKTTGEGKKNYIPTKTFHNIRNLKTPALINSKTKLGTKHGEQKMSINVCINKQLNNLFKLEKGDKIADSL